MISWGDLGMIAAIAFGCAIVVVLAGVGILRLARSRSLLVQLCIVVLTAIASVVLGIVAVADAMYLSQHDIVVVFYVAGVAGIISLGAALILGIGLSRNLRRLAGFARAISAGDPVDAKASGGRSYEFTAVAHELAETSRKLAAAREEVAAIDESRRTLVAWISHDLRTPLAGLRAMAEALEDGLAADPLRFHRQMRSQVDHLSDMVDDLFELSKIQSGTLRLSLEPVRLYDLISDAVAELSPVASARSISLVENFGPDLLVLADDRELSRVIGNLLVNAIEHSPEGSIITIGTRDDGSGRAVLSVTDTGGGIPDGEIARIFEAGWRASSSRTPEPIWGVSTGAGLGLAIAHGIVTAHRGEISVSNVPRGCRFDVALPQHDGRERSPVH